MKWQITAAFIFFIIAQQKQKAHPPLIDSFMKMELLFHLRRK